MKFEEKVSKLINKAEVPDCLSPENIALMLKEKSAEKNRKLEKNTPVISIKMKKRAIIYRTTAAAAACVALVFGAVALFSHNSTSLPTGYIESLGEVKVPSNYSDVFKVFQNSFTKNGKVIEKDDKKPTVNDFSGTQEIGKDDKPSDKPTAAQKEIAAGIQFSLSNEEVEGVSEADIVKSDGSNLYYVANENSLYILAMTNGKMSLVSKTSNENNNPVEMYIDGNRLAVVSNNVVEVPYKLAEKPAETSVSEAVTTSDKAVDTAQTSAEVSTETQVTTNSTTQVSTPVTSGNDKTTVPTTISQSNVVVEFYDISDKAAPKLLTTYKQNGAYVSSRMIGSKIYLVTNYAQYQTKPLEREADLDNYVPAYYINDAKTYIEAKDMCIPTNITGMGYTVVSGLDTQAAAPLTSIKAVLADGSETYFSQNSLYVVGQTKGSKNKDASVITQFKLADGNVSYSANASVDGTLVNSQSMSEINGSFRIATTTTDSKTSKHYTSIFVLDKALKPVKSISNLCSDKTVQAVKFSEKSAYIDIANENENITILIPDEGNPKQAEASDANVQTAFLHKFGDKFVGLDVLTTEKGKNDGLKLTIYDGALKEIASEKLEGNISTTLSCENIGRNAFLFDEEKNVIAIPTVSDGAYGVKNLYYVFTIGGEKGLTKNGVLEYNSISDKLVFNRAMISGDIFYAFSGTKVFSAQLSDLKVIDTVDLK